MIALPDILYRVPLLQVMGQRGQIVEDFHFDSRAVTPGSLFVAVSGTVADGHKFITQAIEKGAIAVVCERLPEAQRPGVTYIVVKDSALSLGYIAANFYGNPAEDVKCVGVTGTNGKSSVTTLLYDLFTTMGYPCGLMGTVEVRIGEKRIPATLTTPDPKQLHAHLAAMRDAGCAYCFMEVSSHALVQHRTVGLPFAGAVFTNLTHDHLDYHGTFENYRDAKKRLFDELPASGFALLNVDDKNGRFMGQNCRGRIMTYALQSPADYHARVLESTFEGQELEINGHDLWVRLLGRFNAYNLLAVVATAHELGAPMDEILVAASQLQPVNGRFQTLHFGTITAVVDYAHTPDALKNSLRTLTEISAQGRILVVVGCGGNRDKEKRPIMAAIACEYADQVILTSDNPRDEDPREILSQMEAGVPVSARRKVLTLADRREAIQTASQMAQPGDVILVAGKGHETYQEVRGQRLHFDDREELLNAFDA